MQEVTVKNKILVVDDNELILFGLMKALSYESYEVETAATGTAALEKLTTCQYDLCLVDIHLPDFNGLDLLKFIKDMCPATKVVIMSASYFNSTCISEGLQEATSNGGCQFVAKPFSLCEMTEVVKRELTEEADLPDGFTRIGIGYGKCRREIKRNVFTDPISFSMTLIVEGETKRMNFQAKAVDVSEEGVGLVTNFPLKISQIVGFEHELDNRSGVVVWSEVVDKQTYRAGVKFA